MRGGAQRAGRSAPEGRGAGAGRAAAELVDRSLTPADVRRLAVEGLRDEPKRLPAILLYDAAGAALFERICELDAYYPTRTELGILRAALPELRQRIGPQARIVEPGSGSGEKTRLLLRAVERPAAYVPVDISRAQLLHTAAALDREFPALAVLPLCADYAAPLRLPRVAARRTVVFFPGSTIGNLEPAEAGAFLRRLRALVGPHGAVIVGVDLRKDPARLVAAYDDPEGVTAAFNLNLLTRLNRECGADFDTGAFRHRAVWNDAASRIEMHLVSRRAQRVSFPAPDPATIGLAAGEAIVTEHSYKYTVAGFGALARGAGLAPARVWVDDDELFSLHWLEPAAGRGPATA
jgi:dimethylhistidine N-methyltransferase